MKKLFLVCIIISLFTQWVYATDYYTSPPSSATLNSDGWYHLDGDRYKEASSSSSNINSNDTSNILGVEDQKLKDGNVDMNTIPLVIVSVISTLLAVAGTVAVFSLIYHAVQMQINSGITWDSSGVDKAKKWMIGALIGFVIAIAAWFLVTRAVELLTNIT